MFQYSPVVTNIGIRGVSQTSYADQLEAPIAVYIDDEYVAANGAIAGSLFDMDRIEVLRGPQGTLFGRNATGGLVHYVTNKPTETPDGYFSTTGAKYGEVNVQGAFGGPIVGDLLGRLAFSYNRADGYLVDSTGPTTPQQNNYALRGQLAQTFAGNIHALLTLHYSRDPHEATDAYVGYAAVPNAQGLGTFVGPAQNPYGTCPGCNLVGYRYPSPSTYERSTVGPHDFNRTVRGAGLTITSALGAANLTVISDYYTMNKGYAETSDPSPIPVLEYFTNQYLTQFSQEVRLDGQAGNLRWVGGVYYLDLRSNDFENLPIPPFSLDYQDTFEQRTHSEAAFGQLEYAFTNQLSGILGGRYSFDQKEFDAVNTENVAPETIVIYNPTTFPSAKRDFDGFSGKAELDYRLMKDVLVYGSVNRGYKGGNWNPPLSGVPVATATIPHNAEKLTSYELGEKITWGGGKIRLNGDVFYYDYKDYQAYSLQLGVPTIFNRNAYLYGGEIDIAAVPVRGLTAQLGYAGLHTNVADVTLPSGAVLDRRMPMAPQASATSLLRYEWPALGGTLALQGDGKYDSAQYFTTFNAPVELDRARFIGNVRAFYTYKASQYSWELSAFVRNVTDKLYFSYGADISSLGFAQYTLAPPRVAGATVSVRYR